MKRETIKLCQLKEGDSATVSQIGLYGPIRRRIFDLGLVPGTQVRCLYAAPSGSPVAYEVRGATIAIRRNDAQQIEVQMS